MQRWSRTLEVAAHLVVGQEVADGEDRSGAVQVPRANAELGALAGACRLQRCKQACDRSVMVAARARADTPRARARRRPASPPDGRARAARSSSRRHAHRSLPLGRAVHRHRRARVEHDGPVGHRIPIRTGGRSVAGAVPSAASRCGGLRRRRHSRGDRDAGCRRRPGA